MKPSEQRVAERLQVQGRVVIKMAAKGNPDFLVIDKARGTVEFVEVKSGSDIVHRHQLDQHKRLRAEGFVVRVINADTMEEIARPDPTIYDLCRDSIPEGELVKWAKENSGRVFDVLGVEPARILPARKE